MTQKNLAPLHPFKLSAHTLDLILNVTQLMINCATYKDGITVAEMLKLDKTELEAFHQPRKDRYDACICFKFAAPLAVAITLCRTFPNPAWWSKAQHSKEPVFIDPQNIVDFLSPSLPHFSDMFALIMMCHGLKVTEEMTPKVTTFDLLSYFTSYQLQKAYDAFPSKVAAHSQSLGGSFAFMHSKVFYILDTPKPAYELHALQPMDRLTIGILLYRLFPRAFDFEWIAKLPPDVAFHRISSGELMTALRAETPEEAIDVLRLYARRIL